MRGPDPEGVDHPRLVVLVAADAVVMLAGALLGGRGPGQGTLTVRLAVLGFLVVALGVSGYVEFWAFERQ